jgi:hypothetical protein
MVSGFFSGQIPASSAGMTGKLDSPPKKEFYKVNCGGTRNLKK